MWNTLFPLFLFFKQNRIMLVTLHSGLNLKKRRRKEKKKAGGKDAQEQLSQMPLLCSAMRIMEWIYLTYLVSQHIWQLWTQHSSAALFFFCNIWYISTLSDSISQNKNITY